MRHLIIILLVLLLGGLCCLLLPFSLFGLSPEMNMMMKDVVFALMPLIVVSSVYGAIERFTGGIGKGKISQSKMAREGVAILWAGAAMVPTISLFSINDVTFIFTTLFLWAPLIYLLRSKILCIAWMGLLLFALGYAGGYSVWTPLLLLVLGGLWIAPAIYKAMGLKKLHIMRFNNWLSRYFVIGWFLAYLILWIFIILTCSYSIVIYSNVFLPFVIPFVIFLLIFVLAILFERNVGNPFYMPVKTIFGTILLIMSLTMKDTVVGLIVFGFAIGYPLYVSWKVKTVWQVLLFSVPFCIVWCLDIIPFSVIIGRLVFIGVLGLIVFNFYLCQFIQKKKKEVER